MDSYKGKFPLDFISSHLEMTTEAQDTANVTSESKLWEETHSLAPAGANPPIESRPLSNLSSTSRATEESLFTYAERTVEAIIARDNPGIVFFCFPQ